MQRRPGTPSLLRELNDRSALELLLAGGPMTRSQLGKHTGLSKVTASQLLARLEERGIVAVAGELAGGRGPNAALYAVVPSTAYVAGLHVERDEVSAGVADITGNVVARISVDPSDSADPVALVRGAVLAACASAGVPVESLRAFVIGTPGVLDPRTGDPRLAVNLPAWHEGVLDALRSDLGRPVTLENDVNLAAMAERAAGAALGVPDFVLVWIGVGLGLATVLGGKLHRGVGGAAGEIGYLPVPGVPLPEDLTHPATGAFQRLVGAQAVLPLARSYGITEPTAAAAVAAAVAAVSAAAVNGAAVGGAAVGGAAVGGAAVGGAAVNGAAVNGASAGARGADDFLRELAVRVATGVAAISVVLDPGLVVLGGDVGLAGGTELASRVAADVGRLCPARPTVVPTAVAGWPVLRGAILAAVDQARAELLASVAEPV